MRDIGKELDKLNVQTKVLQSRRKYGMQKKIEDQKYPLVLCPECGDRIPHHHNLIQRHFLERHKIDDRVLKKEKGWKFVPVFKRAKNPMDLRNIIQ